MARYTNGRLSIWWSVGIALLWSIGPPLVAAPPALDYFFPAGAMRGQTVRVTAAGKFDPWPVTAWVDRAGLSIDTETEPGKLRITVASDARPGVYWIRLNGPQGATGLRPFLVGILPEVLEREPNDTVTESQPVRLSSTVNGQLEKSGDVDVWSVTLGTGQTLVASVTAHAPLGSPMDAILQICCQKGFVLQQNDDFHGLDPQIIFDAPRDGEYVVRIFAFPATPNSTIAFSGSPSYVYRLMLTTSGFLDHSVPLAVNRTKPTPVRLGGWNIEPTATAVIVPPQDVADQVCVFQSEVSGTLCLPVYDHAVLPVEDEEDGQVAPSLEWPVTITGRISVPHEMDSFRFQAAAGQKLVFRVDSSSLGYPLDPELRLFDGTGRRLAEADDTSAARDPVLTHAFRQDGQYRITVGDRFGHGGFRYVYRLTVVEARPDFSLRLASDTFQVKVGEAVELPVTVARREGFAGQITITATDLPDGVVVEPVRSVAEETSSKLVKLKISSRGPPGSGVFHIGGTSDGEPPVTRTAGFPLAKGAESNSDLWLTVVRGTAD